MQDFKILLREDRFRAVWLTGMMIGVFRWLELLAIGVDYCVIAAPTADRETA